MKGTGAETSSSVAPADQNTTATGPTQISSVAEEVWILVTTAIIPGDPVGIDPRSDESGVGHHSQIDPRTAPCLLGSRLARQSRADLVSNLVAVAANGRREGSDALPRSASAGIQSCEQLADHPRCHPPPAAVGNCNDPQARIRHHHQRAVGAEGEEEDSLLDGDEGVVAGEGLRWLQSSFPRQRPIDTEDPGAMDLAGDHPAVEGNPDRLGEATTVLEYRLGAVTGGETEVERGIWGAADASAAVGTDGDQTVDGKAAPEACEEVTTAQLPAHCSPAAASADGFS